MARRFGSAPDVHRKRGATNATLARSFRYLFRRAMINRKCSDALSALLGASRSLGASAAHRSSYAHRGTGNNRRAIESMRRQYEHACSIR